MQLLDASLAFVLTLAALATVVTTIMEAGFRMVRMRKKKLIKVMKLLNKELEKGPLKMSPEERWEFFSKVVKNPAKTISLASEINWKKKSDEEDKKDPANSLSSFNKRKDLKGVFNKVTLEHVLRCLAERDSVKRTALESRDKLKTELNRLARKYEEFGSAVSSSFKQSAQSWSIGIGIFLAFAANVDGIRIFETYRADPKLAAAVIEKHEAFLEKNKEVKDSMERLKALYLMEGEKKSEIKKAEQAQRSNDEINNLEKELKEIQTRISEQSEIANIQKTIQEAKNQVAELGALGVPIGWDFYPNCPYGKDESEWLKSSPECREIPKEKRAEKWDWLGSCPINSTISDTTGFIIWVLKVIITGIIIGLGAPFWFDVAKRLAQIRKGLKNPNASSEDRLAARDANGDAEERKKIVEDVVEDTIKEAAVSVVEQPLHFVGPRGLVL